MRRRLAALLRLAADRIAPEVPTPHWSIAVGFPCSLCGGTVYTNQTHNCSGASWTHTFTIGGAA